MSRTAAICIVLGLGLLSGTASAQAVSKSLRPLPRPESSATTPAPSLPAPDLDVIADDSLATGDDLGPLRLPVPRPADLMKGREMRLALATAQDGNWTEAARIASAGGPVAVDIITWMRLRKGVGSIQEYQAFLDRNADWPGLKLLRARGEGSISTDIPADLVIAYFAKVPPQTGIGSRRLVAAYQATGNAKAARAELVRAWTAMDLSKAEEAAFLTDYPTELRDQHAARLDFLLWQRERAGAERMLPLVDADHQALARARLALQRRKNGVDALLDALPASVAGDSGLAFDRVVWRIANKQRQEAADLIIARSGSAASLGRPEYWANWRRILARQEMREGRTARAYALASRHWLSEGSDYADLEWLSGYLALTYLKKPKQALIHFAKFRAAVFTPISLGRAGYWQGRAYEALNDAAAARAAFSDAGQYQTSFYGLLAAEKAGLAMDPDLTGLTHADAWHDAAFTKTSLFTAAGLFDEAGQRWETVRFLGQLVKRLDPAALVQLTDYVLSLDDPFLAVRVSKQAAYAGTVTPRAYFPLTSLGEGVLPVSEALALSIARRESEFHAAAVSGAGARGLMQLMPGTAKQMARELGIPYSKARLTSDPVYNAQLGSAYLARLIEEFGKNYVLVAAGYNAGPRRVREWIVANGDPRDPGVDAVDWIEHIPFRETRNYVMRVAESVLVYRARLSGKPAPIRLSQDLKAR